MKISQGAYLTGLGASIEKAAVKVLPIFDLIARPAMCLNTICSTPLTWEWE